MTRRAPISILALGIWSVASVALAQGAVQDLGPRRVLAPIAEEVCELWRGDIHGNDPSAEITARLCTRDGRVTGVIAWSSHESGSDRRSIEGEWRADGGLFVGRDTAMLEAHPLNGWTLCTSDAYSLRRVSPDRLEGTYTSERCRDHGRLAMTRVPSPPSKPEGATRDMQKQPAAVTTRAARVSFHTTAGRCSVTPGAPGTPDAWVLVIGAAIACVARRRRG